MSVIDEVTEQLLRVQADYANFRHAQNARMRELEAMGIRRVLDALEPLHVELTAVASTPGELAITEKLGVLLAKLRDEVGPSPA